MRHLYEKTYEILTIEAFSVIMFMIEIESSLTGITNKMYMDISAEQVEEWNRPGEEDIKTFFLIFRRRKRVHYDRLYPQDWKKMEDTFR